MIAKMAAVISVVIQTVREEMTGKRRVALLACPAVECRVMAALRKDSSNALSPHGRSLLPAPQEHCWASQQWHPTFLLHPPPWEGRP